MRYGAPVDATTIDGHALGPLTLLVGRDRMAIFAALYTLGAPPHSGLSRVDVARLAAEARADGVPLLLVDLGDSMHWSALPALMTALRACGVQVVASTHSPLVVDQVAAEEVLVHHEDRWRRLSEHPQRRALESLTTGEFWMAVGEEWVS